jgi:putative Mg2+ transporter-C (MgtC) family protein
METFELLRSIMPMFLIRGGFAVLSGALIGIERERKGKPAGFRTNTLICFGSALYMMASEFIIVQLGGSSVDPTRIAAQVVTGIGFIGAGTIIQARGTITGLTSAATIWVVAGIGIVIGAGFPWLGLLCTILVLITLVGLTKVEPRLLVKCQHVQCVIVFADHGGRTRAEIASVLAEHDVDLSRFVVEKPDHNTSRVVLTYCDKHPSHHRFLADLWRTPRIIEVTKKQ